MANIGNDYGFSGRILDASINITKEFHIKNLTTEINHTKDNTANLFNIRIKKGSLLDFELADSIFILKRENSETDVESSLKINGEFNFSKVKKISSLLNLNLTNIEDIKGKGYLETNIDFKLNKKYRIKNLTYSMEGEIPYTEIYFKEKKIIKKYLPDYKDAITLKDSKIKFNKTKLNNVIELDGFMKINNNFDGFNVKQIYDYSKKTFNIVGNIDLVNSKINISKLNYTKDDKKESEVNFNLDFILNKYFNIKKLVFLSDKTKIDITSLKLNKNFETNDFEKLEIKTFKNGK